VKILSGKIIAEFIAIRAEPQQQIFGKFKINKECPKLMLERLKNKIKIIVIFS